MLAAV